MEYIYRGEMQINNSQLLPLLKSAEQLQIKGLSCGSTEGTTPSDTTKANADDAAIALAKKLILSVQPSYNKGEKPLEKADCGKVVKRKRRRSIPIVQEKNNPPNPTIIPSTNTSEVLTSNTIEKPNSEDKLPSIPPVSTDSQPDNAKPDNTTQEIGNSCDKEENDSSPDGALEQSKRPKSNKTMATSNREICEQWSQAMLNNELSNENEKTAEDAPSASKDTNCVDLVQRAIKQEMLSMDCSTLDLTEASEDMNLSTSTVHIKTEDTLWDKQVKAFGECIFTEEEFREMLSRNYSDIADDDTSDVDDTEQDQVGQSPRTPSRASYQRKYKTADGLFQCDVCPNSYTQFSDLHRHMTLQCSGVVTPFTCTCGITCTRKDQLLRHKRSCCPHLTNSTDCVKLTNNCDFCGATFNQVDHLKAHDEICKIKFEKQQMSNGI